MQSFLEMGGYGAYVWPAYIVSAGALVAIAALIRRRARTLSKKLRAANESVSKRSAA
ncbi:MAG: heme exporter protein CcmD [Parvularculaceae bacterium]|nr:heme exporter protein CcmD [Parvularculaceae bacterium]